LTCCSIVTNGNQNSDSNCFLSDAITFHQAKGVLMIRQGEHYKYDDFNANMVIKFLSHAYLTLFRAQMAGDNNVPDEDRS
jgi:hypothetical protein